MVKYLFSLRVKGSPEEYRYDLDLQPHEENTPEKAFTPQRQEDIRASLQNQSLCAIKDHHLQQIIKTWSEDIKEGFRSSNITLNLPLLSQANLEQLSEPGNQEIPALVTPDLSGIEPLLGMLPPLVFA